MTEAAHPTSRNQEGLKMGRPRFEPTAEQRKMVKTLAGYGILQEEIAKKLGITPKTLRLRFREELDLGATEANAQVVQSLYKMALSGRCPAAAIFWLKNRAGWKENGRMGRETQPSEPFVVNVMQGPEPKA